MCKRMIMAAVAAFVAGTAMAKDRIVIVPAHPDDLIATIGFCLLAKDTFDIHVVDYTHGERGLGQEAFTNGTAKATRIKEEESVCKAVGATLHWLDEIDGEAYACRETCERLANVLKELKPCAVFGHWPVDIHGDHMMAGAALMKAVFLANIAPEFYFFEEEYQSKAFVPDHYVDITSVLERKFEIVRQYKCQYFDGGMERRHRAGNHYHGMHTAMLAFGHAEAFKALFPSLQGQKNIFQELPPSTRGKPKFQGARPKSLEKRTTQPIHAPWPSREQEKSDQISKSGGNIDLVFVGDSITHGWENDGRGKSLYNELCKTYSILNLGYSGQRTENMVWRLENGELDGYRAKLFMVMAGTNNPEPAEEVAAGVHRILDVIRSRQPDAKILLLPIFPRGETAADARNAKNAEVNKIIQGFADGEHILWCDFTPELCDSAGGMSGNLSQDRLHLNEAGYAIWLKHVLPHFERTCGK